MKKMKKGEISKGFEYIPNRHLYKDCRFCIFNVNGCINRNVLPTDIVIEFGRTYCRLFERGR